MSLKNYEKYKKSFDFRGIFTPTLTSELIIKFSEKYLLKNQRILDLGCGGGIISASLYRKKLNQSFYLSDLDLLAVKRAKKNLEPIKTNFTIKQGNLWRGFPICATRAVIVNAATLSVYEKVKSLI